MTVDPRRAAALTAPDNETHDVWVLSDSAPRPHVSLWAPTLQTARIERSQRVIQSRVADNLFWLGRYAERTDWTLRVLRSALRRVEEDSGPATGQRAAIRTMELLLDGTPLPAPAKSTPAATLERARIEQVAQTLVRSKGVGRALPVTIEGLFRNAYLVRDRLSLEAWQTLSRFRPGDMWSAAIAAARPAAMLDQVEEGLSFVAAFNGLMHENMTRNFGWSFIALGRRLERAYNLAEATLGLFEVRPEAEEERSHLLLLLELADSFITYRSRYRLDPMLALTLDLLMLDETNPRSLAFQLAEIDRHLRSLPAGTRTDEPEDRRLSRVLLESVRATDLEAIEADLTGRSLAAELVRPLELLPELSDALSRHYFNLTEDAPQALRAHPELKP